MTDEETQRYGELLYAMSEKVSAEARGGWTKTQWDHLSPSVQQQYIDEAARFVEAAGLVPLAAVRAAFNEIYDRISAIETDAGMQYGSLVAEVEAERFGGEQGQ